MIALMKKIGTWILDIALLRPPPLGPGPKATANPPPWDVPLDQTEAPMHYEGDITSV
jgi:hypothetical protein